MLITIIATTPSPPIRYPGTQPHLRGYYSSRFIAGDTVTPVEQGNGQTGFYYDIPCTVNGSGNLVIPAFQIQATEDGNLPTSRFTGRLYDQTGAPREVIFGGADSNAGWRIPTLMGNIVSWADLARYNAAYTLLNAAPTYATYAQVVELINLLVGRALASASGPGYLTAGLATTIPAVLTTSSTAIIAIAASDTITGNLRIENRVTGVSFDVVSDNGADSGLFYWFVFGTFSTVSPAIGYSGYSGFSGSAGPGVIAWPYSGDGTTAIGHPVKVVSNVAVITTTADTDGCIGIVISGSASQVMVLINGVISTGFFDSDMTGMEGYYVVLSPTVNGSLHALPAWPTAGQVIGRVRSVTNFDTIGVIDVFGDEVRAGALLQFNNLSDVLDVAFSRANLGLGNAATKNIGTTAGTVMAGDDSRVAESTSSNIANTIVKRGPSGEFAAGLIEVTQVDSTGPIEGTHYTVSGTQVVGTQGASVADATDAPSVILRLNDLLSRLRVHGLIASPTPPAAPTALNATTFSSSRIDLVWTDNSGGTAGFKIERSLNGVNFSQIDTNIPGDTTYSNTGLTQNTLYYYRVRAYNAEGNSAYTNIDSDTTSSGPIAPNAVAGLLVWYKADALGLADNDPVVTWTDSSSNVNDATQATADKQPLFKTNQINTTLPIVRFDGSNDTLGFTQLTNVQSLFIVLKHTTGTQDYAPLLGDSVLFNWAGGSRNMIFDANASPNVTTNATAYVNGQLDTAANLVKPTAYRLVEVIGVGPTTVAFLTNDRDVLGRCWNGDYAEVAAYSTTVGSGDRQGLEQYFANKYGSTISATAVLRNHGIFVGDSLTVGSGVAIRVVNEFAGVSPAPGNGPVLDGPWFQTTFASSGYTLQDMGAFDTNVAALRYASRTKQAVVLWGGTNDLYLGASVGTTESRLTDRINSYLGSGYGVAGAPIVIVTTLPRSNLGTPINFEANRQLLNAWILANTGMGYVVADVASDPVIGQAGQETNTTYYTDLVHQTGLGQDVVELYIFNAITAAP
jgi:hypothetical protein